MWLYWVELKEAQMAIDGTWNLSMTTPMGTREVPLLLASSGAELTGEFQAPQGNSPVKGSIEGKSVTFTTMFTGAMGPMELTFNGDHEGDSVSGTVQFGMFGSGPFSATRA
jgi:hypothetical protein